jgi:mannose-6-phosphate isomerase-like protein (cupin superfamily)
MSKTSVSLGLLLPVLLVAHLSIAGSKDQNPKTALAQVQRVFDEQVAGLDLDHHLALLVVTVAADTKETAHTHPGEEILYGLSGHGAVFVDGVRFPIEPNSVVRVKAGQKKRLSNEGNAESLRVLAVLVLDKHRPPITVLQD